MKQLFEKRLMPEGVRAYASDNTNVIYLVGETSILYSKPVFEACDYLDKKGFVALTVEPREYDSFEWAGESGYVEVIV